MNHRTKTWAMLIVLCMTLLQGCKKEPVYKGCNDQDALNYDPDASPGGDCEYPSDKWVGTYEVEQEYFYQSNTGPYWERSTYNVTITKVDPYIVELSNLFDCGETDIGQVNGSNSVSVIYNCSGLGVDLILNNPNSWSFYQEYSVPQYQTMRGQGTRK